MKNRFTIMGLVLTAIGIVFIVFALANPQLSFPWPNGVTYAFYGFYVTYTILIFCMPRIKNASIATCVILAFEFVALGLIVLSIGVRKTPNDYNWYLPAGLFISALSNFANLYISKKRRKNE